MRRSGQNGAPGAAAPTSSRGRHVLFGLLLASAALVVSLVAAELFLRLLRPQAVLSVSPGLYQSDPNGRYQLTPGYRGTIENRTEFDHPVAVNSSGLRGDEIASKQVTRPRILFIGDSFTFGVGVDNDAIFLNRAETILEKRGVDVECLNGGVPGFGTVDEVRWLENHGLVLQPDVVVLTVFLGNDIQDAPDASSAPQLVNGLLDDGNRPTPTSWLQRHSHLFLFIKSSMPAGLDRRIRKTLHLSESFSIRMLNKEFTVYRKQREPWIDDAVSATDIALGHLVELTRPRGIQLAALLIPSGVQVDSVRWKRTLSGLGLAESDYDSQQPRQIFNRLLRDHSIPTLDLSEPFRAATLDGSMLYYQADRHWTALGHNLAADLLLPKIVAWRDDFGSSRSNAGLRAPPALGN